MVSPASAQLYPYVNIESTIKGILSCLGHSRCRSLGEYPLERLF
eukprot:COSAG02_NODE_40921_length_400_cov_0.594684_1_plen_43_part_01